MAVKMEKMGDPTCTPEMASETCQLQSSRGQVKNRINDLKSLVQSGFIPNKRMAIGPWSPQNFRSP